MADNASAPAATDAADAADVAAPTPTIANAGAQSEATPASKELAAQAAAVVASDSKDGSKASGAGTAAGDAGDGDDEEAEDTQTVPGPDGRLIPVPPKKNKSAYFHFMKQKRTDLQEQNPKATFGRLVQIATEVWHGLSPADKAVFEETARVDKERYLEDVQVVLKATGVDYSKTRKGVDDLDSPATIFPVARIRKVVRLDPDIRHVSGEAFMLLTKAADLFVAYLTEHSLHSATNRKKRKIDKVDVVSSIYAGPEALDFLVPDFDKPTQVVREKRSTTSKAAAKRRRASNPDTNAGNGGIKSLIAPPQQQQHTTQDPVMLAHHQLHLGQQLLQQQQQQQQHMQHLVPPQ